MSTQEPSARSGERSVRLGRAVRDPRAKAVLAVVAGASPDAAADGTPGDGRATKAAGDLPTYASLVRSAAQGLAPRDRVLWELSSTSSLTGAELAAAVDVPPSQIYTVLNRMRRRAWRAMAAILLVENGAAHCRELAAVLDACDDAFSPLVRKRVARHLDRCGRCHGEVTGRLDGLLEIDE